MEIDYNLALDTVMRSLVELTGVDFEDLSPDTRIFEAGRPFPLSSLVSEMEHKFEVEFDEADFKDSETILDIFNVVIARFQKWVDSYNEDFHNRLLNTVASVLGVDKDSLTESTRFQDLTSDMTELQETLEEEFEVGLNLDMEDMHTIGDTIYIINDQINTSVKNTD